MFETIQLLQRIRDHFGESAVVSIGIALDCIYISLTIRYDETAFDTNFVLPILFMDSNVPNAEIEKMIITRFEQQHMQWEVGEI